jgi:hypothetical protein
MRTDVFAQNYRLSPKTKRTNGRRMKKKKTKRKLKDRAILHDHLVACRKCLEQPL